MSLRISTSVDSLRVLAHVERQGAAIARSFEHLASGLRIASAADDAAGLGISERMRASIRSLGAASRNLQDGISLGETAEGALQETASLLVRLRELAVQASNGTLTAADRDALDRETSSIVTEIDRIARHTRWGDRALLDGTTPRVRIQADIQAGNELHVELGDASASALRIRSLHVDTHEHAQRALASVDAAIQRVSSLRAALGASIHRLQSAWSSAQADRENLVASESRIRDVDVAEETSNLVRNQILHESSVSVLRQANLQPVLALLLLTTEP